MNDTTVRLALSIDDANDAFIGLSDQLTALRKDVNRLTPRAHKGTVQRRIWTAKLAQRRALQKLVDQIAGHLDDWERERFWSD
jgi:ribosomal protein L17